VSVFQRFSCAASATNAFDTDYAPKGIIYSLKGTSCALDTATGTAIST
jgi:hypothetical protein